MASSTGTAPAFAGANNKLRVEDRAAHDWYRFVLSFPPHLVREYLDRFGVGARDLLLDPFCGTGTTLVECRKQGIPAIGVEANPMACFASRVKVDWSIDPDELIENAERIARLTRRKLEEEGTAEEISLPLFRAQRHSTVELRSLPRDQMKLLLRDCISPLPLHRTLALLAAIQEHGKPHLLGHQQLALAKVAVFHASNLHFGPEVGVKGFKEDAPVLHHWMETITGMARDLRALKSLPHTSVRVQIGDARDSSGQLAPGSISAVITSPPYPNEKDYTRTTRLELVLLGFLKNKEDLRTLKKSLVRSNTRSVYRSDGDDEVVRHNPRIQRIARAIEKRRVDLGKTSGFERLYSRVTKLYFGGMARHLANLRPALRDGAQLAYVVGDQASYLRVMIRTGELLAELAESLGYEIRGIDLFRTRLATATKEQLREEVVLLRWPGEQKKRNKRT